MGGIARALLSQACTGLGTAKKPESRRTLLLRRRRPSLPPALPLEVLPGIWRSLLRHAVRITEPPHRPDTTGDSGRLLHGALVGLPVEGSVNHVDEAEDVVDGQAHGVLHSVSVGRHVGAFEEDGADVGVIVYQAQCDVDMSASI